MKRVRSLLAFPFLCVGLLFLMLSFLIEFRDRTETMAGYINRRIL